MYLKSSKNFLKSSEEVVSMFLGLLIVIILVGLIFNFVQKRRGTINLPGISTSTVKEGDLKPSSISENNESQNKNYEVVRGDSLWKIAEKEYGDGNKWVNIAKENKLTNPRVLMIGQKLILPKNDPTKIAEKQLTNTINSGEYTVERGDSLWKIAVRAYSDGNKWTEIWNSNKNLISNPNKIYKGTKLVIPNLSK
ncbi:MAG: LysM peptidoglycan-binding domain-containing protein [Candidatus Shapirobacteria bacterium]|nr:LysM peptidoglycan-binding domain-containing protein [Candidatus Shapirobacteria bacterium]